VTLLSPDGRGVITPESLQAALRPDTLLATLMHVNNETGVINPIADYCTVLEDHDAYLHVDAAQGFGKLTGIEFPRIDLLSISGHKIYAPKGVGALITRKRKWSRPPLTPLMFGGGQEKGLRPGTHPVPPVP
jgi:cysteine desulfurase